MLRPNNIYIYKYATNKNDNPILIKQRAAWGEILRITAFFERFKADFDKYNSIIQLREDLNC